MTKQLKNISVSALSFLIISCTGDTQELVQASEAIKPIGNFKVNLADSIKINNNLYYIPIGKDGDNCTMYQAYSDTMATAQVIIYQNTPNKFSMSKNKDSCL
jgi:glucose-6-phosphate isomerase